MSTRRRVYCCVTTSGEAPAGTRTATTTRQRAAPTVRDPRCAVENLGTARCKFSFFMIEPWFGPEPNLPDLNLGVQVKVQAFLGPNLEVRVRVLARMSRTRTGPDRGQSTTRGRVPRPFLAPPVTPIFSCDLKAPLTPPPLAESSCWSDLLP